MKIRWRHEAILLYICTAIIKIHENQVFFEISPPDNTVIENLDHSKFNQYSHQKIRWTRNSYEILENYRKSLDVPKIPTSAYSSKTFSGLFFASASANAGRARAGGRGRKGAGGRGWSSSSTRSPSYYKPINWVVFADISHSRINIHELTSHKLVSNLDC